MIVGVLLALAGAAAMIYGAYNLIQQERFHNWLIDSDEEFSYLRHPTYFRASAADEDADGVPIPGFRRSPDSSRYDGPVLHDRFISINIYSICKAN
jgi:hypothetical protein